MTLLPGAIKWRDHSAGSNLSEQELGRDGICLQKGWEGRREKDKEGEAEDLERDTEEGWRRKMKSTFCFLLNRRWRITDQRGNGEGKTEKAGSTKLGRKQRRGQRNGGEEQGK